MRTLFNVFISRIVIDVQLVCRTEQLCFNSWGLGTTFLSKIQFVHAEMIQTNTQVGFYKLVCNLGNECSARLTTHKSVKEVIPDKELQEMEQAVEQAQRESCNC